MQEKNKKTVKIVLKKNYFKFFNSKTYIFKL